MWADSLTQRYLFFTGKGGVGKTSLSCAAALQLATMGRRVLIVSTDPASNLDETLQVLLSADPTPVPSVERLWAANLDPEEAAQRYRDRAVNPYRGLLPDATIRNMEEQLSGACTTEIAAFDEFTRLLAGDAVSSEFDHVVFDTAPTGHTLRLLSLPAAWSGFIDTNTTGVTCIGPLSALKQQDALYKQSLETLKDGSRTLVVLVARPDESSLKEAARAAGEMQALEINNQRLLINGLFHTSDPSDAVACALEKQGNEAIAALPAALSVMPTETIPLMPLPIIGLDAIRMLLHPAPDPISSCEAGVFVSTPTDTLDTLVRQIALDGRGLVMTMGKGGVGKTTIAADIACRLADLGHDVLLTTTDPAAHVLAAVGDSRDRLVVERIDPEREVAAYRDEVLSKSGSALDAEGIGVLEEDLRSPCTEEIAVFRAFARAVACAEDRFVVIDTAPTGHTILLLDAAEAYHREVLRTQTDMPAMVKELLPRLRDPRFTRVLIVTLPEPTPVHEASRLQDDLRRASIEPFAWIVNQSFLLSGTQDPLLLARARREISSIAEVGSIAHRYSVLPWTIDAHLLASEPNMEIITVIA